jgi:transcriptional regulator with XRE-family HTH domain
MKSGGFANLGLALAIFREFRGLSQKELAHLSHAGKSQVSKYESGHGLPQLPCLERLLDVLEVPQDVFFFLVAMLDHVRDRVSKPTEGVPPHPSAPLSSSFSPLGTAVDEVYSALFKLQKAALVEALRARSPIAAALLPSLNP